MMSIYDSEKKYLLPSRLYPGDTIAIAAPASPFDRDILYQGIDILESMGFRVNIPDDLFETRGYLAGSDAHRANLLNSLFDDDEIKAIICAKGGYGSIRILPLIDYETIRNNPKIFIGFSDITALINAIYSKCGMVTFHGPMVTTLRNATQETKDALFSAISAKSPIEIKPHNGITIKRGIVTGTILGGNLTTFCHLIGTPYFPNLKRHILFLEDRGEACYRIDRMFNQLKIAGYLKQISGLFIGSFEDCGNIENILEIVEDCCSEYEIPIAAGFDIGHGVNNMTIPIGHKATLNADKQIIFYQEPAIQ